MQLNAFVLDMSTKFSHKNQIESYKESPYRPLKYCKKNLNDKLVFCFLYLKKTNTA